MSGASVSTGSIGSVFSFLSRASMFAMVNSRGSSFGVTSLHSSGVDTGAPGSGRTLKGATIVLPRAVLQVVHVHLARRSLPPAA